jgi:hypothetical protein
MITVGPMLLNQPQAADPMEPFFLGTQSGGGYWTDISRLSSHDHSGGLMGAPVAVNIPDGSITAADLDPSVLAPYALTDGSKPFTGQVTMQADAIIRDELLFGPQGSAAAPDVHVLRTGAGALRVDTHLGVGVNPTAWGSGFRALQVGQVAALWGDATGVAARLSSNTVNNGTANISQVVGASSIFYVDGAYLTFMNAPSVAAGATQTFTTRASIAPTGSLTLTPDAAAAGINVNWPTSGLAVVPGTMGATNARFYTSHNIELDPGTGTIHPPTDNTKGLGFSGGRWTAVYAVGGVITTSSQEFKEGITPLSPERAMQAVRNTEAVTFDYLAPTRGPEWYDLPDDPEQAEAVLQQRLTAAPLEAAARHQHGFIAEDCDPLFLVGEGQTSPGSSIGVLLAALQNIDSRLSALETP